MNDIKKLTQDDIFRACAQAAHEMNRVYCETLGDTSQMPWSEAPEWQQTSALNGVKGVLLQGNSPRQSHESWLQEKRETGWKYGPVKDPEKKEHPCFVAYEDLPEAQKRKDLIFVETVRNMSMALNFQATPA